ncbi:nucleoside deaminase [Muribaculum intestinale]|jgi:tRNA(adenine34) deaminase|uniref:nucleoside deaminase n=1 Tax=Muribaculum intestinale TaxID=1796646 RepID=UPI00242CE09F|nr:nucleoside deaminase [Muribaculum intestinale]
MEKTIDMCHTGDDERWMRAALDEARRAMEADEIPIGAVIVAGGRIIGRGHNLTETLADVTAHAEMQAITAAASTLGGKYMPDATLYVTVEPCPMCAGAIGWSQIRRVVYGASDEKRGYSRIMSRSPFHPKCTVTSGVLAEECASLMRSFFASKR